MILKFAERSKGLQTRKWQWHLRLAVKLKKAHESVRKVAILSPGPFTSLFRRRCLGSCKRHSRKPRDRGSSKVSWCRGSVMWGHFVSFSVGRLLVISDGCSSSWYRIFIWQCPKVVKSKSLLVSFENAKKPLQNSFSRSRGSVTLHTHALPILFKWNTITW